AFISYAKPGISVALGGSEVSRMSRTLWSALVLAAGGLVVNVQPALAQQTINFTIGHFSVRGEDSRVSGDVLNADLQFLTFNLSDFRGATIGGEWLVPIGEYFEGGAGLSFTRRTVPSVYTNFVNSDGTEIEQNLRLRTIPVAFTFRVLPLSRRSPLQPYF